ncbi:MAG: aminopeptidase P family N-terminal domain-containing protein [Bacteroidales bacterium]|jgi:Xaa-Pro aminopeptidase
MNISEKIQALRILMQEAGWDAVLISGTDPHGSEYLPERWQQRKWISGFTGSYGTVVITRDHAGLWTDTRYFIQFRREMEDTDFELHPLRVPDAVDYPEWLAENLASGSVLGIDGECLKYRDAERLKKALKGLNATLDNRPSFLSAIWNDMPGLPLNPVFVLEEKYTGKATRDKLEHLRKQIKEQGCTHIVLNSLDQIAWLFNIRCHDIPYNPVAVSYALVDKKNATLFVTPEKVSENVSNVLLEQGVSVLPYDSLSVVLQSLPKGTRIMADGDSLNYSTFNNLLTNCTVHDVQSPVILDKAIKNSVETDGFRKAYLNDGIALERFFFWLERSLEKNVVLTETDVAKKLSWMRTLADGAMGDSFQYISAYGPNASLPHYAPNPRTALTLEKKGLYLIDSGGHYLYGTTDTTRTVPLGSLTQEEREDYTLALKGMIALSRAVFLKGTKGTHLDMLVRDPMWRHRINYGHGTGHGTGHFLCVHEGPQDIRMTWRDQDILPGMVTSNEPGIYREGSHGVRHENVLLCNLLEENEFGTWLGFETLTLCHIDTSPLVVSLMEPSEIKWLNDYNKTVYTKLASFLTYEESVWLEKRTAPVKA